MGGYLTVLYVGLGVAVFVLTLGRAGGLRASSPPGVEQRCVMWIWGALPLAALVLLVVLGLRARVGYGAWPVDPAHTVPVGRRFPNPEFAYPIHSRLTAVCLVLSLWSTAVAVPILAFCWVRYRTAFALQVVVYVSGLSLVAWVCLVDSAGWVAWLLD